MFLFAVLLIGQQAAAPPLAPQAPAQQADVVITGNRMRDALNKCLARNCPPEEEVDAAMNTGAESFAAGRYDEAKAILRRAVSRNKSYAARMPGPISDLYATYADVTEHEGDEGAFRHATRESIGVLRDVLGPAHPAVQSLSSRVGDMWVKLGNPTSADTEYREAAGNAARAGNTDLAAALTFRRAWLAVSAQEFGRSRRLLAQLERSHGNDVRFAGLLRVLRVRISIAKGNEDGVDDLVAALRGAGGADPVLIHDPPYPVLDFSALSAISRTGSVDLMGGGAATLGDKGDLAWADIGYWVRPDGRPGDIDILRPVRGAQWAKPLIKYIEARRYVPPKQAAGGLGAYRIERFTLRPAYGSSRGTRLIRRAGMPSLHVIDLTELAQRESGVPRP